MSRADMLSRPGAPLRLGISPLSWVNEVLPEFGAGTTVEQCLSEAASAGFQGVELSRIFPRDPARLSELLTAHGLSLVSGWHSGFLVDRSFEEEVEAVREHAHLLKACGASVMVYGECGRMAPDALDIPMAGRWTLEPEEWAGYGERLTRFAGWLWAEFGLGLAYHHHLMMVAETLDEVGSLMAATGPEVGLLLDTGHAFAAGFDYATLIAEFGPRINHIHLKDVRAEVLSEVRARGLSFNDAVRSGLFTIPGDGNVDFAPVARFLADGRYAGWVLVEAEQDPAKAPPAPTVARAFWFASETVLPATASTFHL